MNRIYQTIIIGAGPAGLIAGRHLKDSLILDQKQEIGKPVQCGEGISRDALKIHNIEPDSSWISCDIHRVERIMPNGKRIGKFHKEAIGYILDRTAFEKFLASTVKAEIKLKSKVVDLNKENNIWCVKTQNGEIFKSKYIIGADGPNSIVREKVFKERIKILPAVEYLLELEKEIKVDTLEIYLNNEKYPQGYAWIFPKSRNTANIGIGGQGDLLEKFREFLEEEVRIKYQNYKILENRSGVVPFAKPSTIIKDGVLLVGDAAGFTNSVFKAGISRAMWSARICSQLILDNDISSHKHKTRVILFTGSKLDRAGSILYAFSNESLNELGGFLENKNASYYKNILVIMKMLFSHSLRKDILKMFEFISIWKKYKKYSW